MGKSPLLVIVQPLVWITHAKEVPGVQRDKMLSFMASERMANKFISCRKFLQLWLSDACSSMVLCILKVQYRMANKIYFLQEILSAMAFRCL